MVAKGHAAVIEAALDVRENHLLVHVRGTDDGAKLFKGHAAIAVLVSVNDGLVHNLMNKSAPERVSNADGVNKVHGQSSR